MSRDNRWEEAAKDSDPGPLSRLVERRVREHFERRADRRREQLSIAGGGNRIAVRSLGWDRWRIDLTISPGQVEIYRWPGGEEVVIDALGHGAAARLEAEIQRAGPAPPPTWDRDDPNDLLRELRWINVALDDLVRDHFDGKAHVTFDQGNYLIRPLRKGLYLDVVVRPGGHVAWVSHEHGKRVRRIVISEMVDLDGLSELGRGRLIEAMRPRRFAASCKRPDRRTPRSRFQ
jgi:hypothetical protein